MSIYFGSVHKKIWEPRAAKVLVNNVVVQAKGEERIKVVQVGDLPKRKKRDGRSGLLIAIVTKMTPWSLAFQASRP